MLTELACNRAPRKNKTYRVSDGNWLYLEVPPTGSKRWIIRYQVDGIDKKRDKSLSLGRYPRVSLKEARKLRDHQQELHENGIDPSEQRKVDKERKKENIRNTFESVADAWLNTRKNEWTEQYHKQISSIIRRNLHTYIGEKPVRKITPDDLLEALRKTESKGHHATVKIARQCASKIFRFAIRKGIADTDIADILREDIATPKTKHHPAIVEPKEVGDFMLQIDGYRDRGTPQVAQALRLLALTFVRSTELIQAKWQEIYWEENLWKIEAKKMKMNEDHIVPLSRQAMEILRDMRKLSNYGYIFSCTKNPQKPIGGRSMNYALLALGYEGEMTPHGFRAMARTLLDEQLGFRIDWIEQQLAHTVKDPLGRAYNRTKHLKERREMMQKYADYLDDLKAEASARAANTG